MCHVAMDALYNSDIFAITPNSNNYITTHSGITSFAHKFGFENRHICHSYEKKRHAKVTMNYPSPTKS